MVKVKFKRDHVEHVEGQEAEVTQERATYLEMTGAIHSDTTSVKEEKQTYVNKMQKGKRKTKAK